MTTQAAITQTNTYHLTPIMSFCIGHWGMLALVLVPLEVPVDHALELTLPAGWREWL